MEINNELEVFHLLFLALNTNWAGYPIKVSPFGNITEISISDALRPGLVRRFWIAIWKGNWSVTN